MQNLPQEYIAHYLEALECELKYQREQGGHPYRVHNGELLSMFHQEYVYLFEFDSEVLIPEGIPVSLSYENEKIYGTVISFEGNQLLLSLQREIGRTVKTAFINISPWKLLEALIEKLRTFSARDQIARSFFEYKNSADLRKTFVKGQVAAKQYAASKNVTVI